MEEKNKDPISIAVDLRESGALEDALEAFKRLKEKYESEGEYRSLVTVLGGMRITYHQLAKRINKDDPDHDKKVLDYLLNAESSINKGLFYIEMHSDVVPGDNKAIFLVHSASTKLDLSSYIKDETEKKAKLLSALQDVNDAIDKLPGSVAHKSWPLALKAKILMSLGEFEDAIETVDEGYRVLREGYDQESKQKDGLRNLVIWETGLKIVEARILDKLKRTDEGMVLLKEVLSTEPPQEFPNCLELRKSEATKLIEEFANKTNE